MALFQILEFEEICEVIVQMPKNGMNKIVSPLEESVLFLYLNTENKTKCLCKVHFQFYLSYINHIDQMA